MATLKEIKMTSSLGEQSFKPSVAQRILVWQKRHPQIRDRWQIVGNDYIFDDKTDEIIRNPDKKPAKKSEA